MRTLGVYNIKGGVGKTATAVNLAFLAARAGLRTLVCDLDPQGATTFYLRVKPKVKGSTKLLRGKRDIDRALKGSDHANLDLLPADFSYRNMDLVLGENKKPVQQLQRLLEPLHGQYDLVVLDCPPSISLVSENVFHAADALLLPVIPTILSLRTLEQLLDFLEGHGLAMPVFAFYSMVDRRKRLHRELTAAAADPRCTVLAAAVPYASEVERMGLERRPVADFAGGSGAARAYRALWEEVRGQLGGLDVDTPVDLPV
jgi:chromosome partitioning protein